MSNMITDSFSSILSYEDSANFPFSFFFFLSFSWASGDDLRKTDGLTESLDVLYYLDNI